jgi:SAM-dependent methyltransferase
VSKAHDESSRQSTPSNEEEAATPTPVRDDGQSSKRTVAGSRRVRVGAAVARERSGPIGIASGDFATPTVRRRTTTQPRGTPAAGGTLSIPIPAPAPAEHEPPPTQDPLPLGATPVDLVDGTSAQSGPPPLPSLDSPFVPPPLTSLDAEAASLAAEAAAVRALDSGPLTPPPDVLVPGATPPPDAKTAQPEAAAAEPADSAVTPPPLAVAEPTPGPEPLAAGPTPGPEPIAAQPTPAPEPIAAQLTPAPKPIAAPPTPAPEPVAVRATPPAAPAAPPVAAPTPPPTPAPDVEGALPVRPMGSDGSAASSDLANDIGVPTPAPVATGEGDLELQGSDELVVEDGADVASVATPPPRPVSAPTTPPPSPPPIPGSFLKTPGPEPKGPPPAPAADSTDSGHGPLLPALPILPEALSQRPRRPKRSKPWFEEVFDEDYLRTLPFMRADQTLREVEFISGALTAEPGSEILDVACGYGRHAIELVQRGYNVTGLDLSLPLLIRAADEAQRRALSVNFVHADMREMAFEKQFDGAYSMLTSFGYFDEETNLRVAERIGRALKPGKRFLLDIVNRDYVVADLPVRVWWEGTGCVVLEEVDFNFHTSRINTHRSIVFEDGRQLEQELSVRAYSLHEIGRLLRQAGFRVVDVSGGLATRGDFFGSASRNLLIVAEKREDEA